MTESSRPFTAVHDAVAAFGEGRFVLLIDDRWTDGPGTRGALLCSAQAADADKVNYLATHARGLICVALTKERIGALDLAHMAGPHPGQATAGFTVSIEASTGVTTGISAADRARTILVATDPTSGSDDLVSPGHVFPVSVHEGGVLVEPAIAEAVVDIAKLAQTERVSGVFSQILSEDGDLAEGPDLEDFARKHAGARLTLSELVQYRMSQERLVRKLESGEVPTPNGTFTISVWENQLDGNHHVLVERGGDEGDDDVAPVVRMHSQCLTGDAFLSHRCDCGFQLREALSRISREGRGALLYLRQEGRGIGLVNKLKAYALQEKGRDTVEANEELGFEADLRDYAIGSQILLAAGYSRIRLMTNNPRKLRDVKTFGITVQERIPIEISPNVDNQRYLTAKREKLGHLLDSLD
jgi:3,4-dihydroxy 2-butanone 4-phosphate synthase/GTP cyclohydrolase II